MGTRLSLHSKFVSLLGSEHVYFQPPESLRLVYPCILYVRDKIVTKKANNETYKYQTRYQVTFISKDPDSEIVDKLARFPHSAHSRFFVSEGLNHDVFDIYY